VKHVSKIDVTSIIVHIFFTVYIVPFWRQNRFFYTLCRQTD